MVLISSDGLKHPPPRWIKCSNEKIINIVVLIIAHSYWSQHLGCASPVCQILNICFIIEKWDRHCKLHRSTIVLPPLLLFWFYQFISHFANYLLRLTWWSFMNRIAWRIFGPKFVVLKCWVLFGNNRIVLFAHKFMPL